MRIAVIGTGIAGNAAAWALAPRHDLTVYERDLRPGGHSHTVDVVHGDKRIAVDTGFIVYNELNYPNLTRLFAALGVETKASDMGFSVCVDGGRLEWAGHSLRSVFAQKRNLARPSFLWMLREIVRFNREAQQDRAAGRLAGLTLGAWLDRRGFGLAFRQDYLLAMAAAIWSMPAREVLDFPAESFVAFFANHRLMHFERPVWRTVEGGSRRYVEAMVARYRDRLRLGTAVTGIRRVQGGVAVSDSHGRTEVYDHVVLAAHSDEALAMLEDATAEEAAVLGAIRYAPNEVYLHSDPALMPTRRLAWAAWNYLRQSGPAAADKPVAVTYWMNELQGTDPSLPLFVTLNPHAEPRPDLVHARFTYAHPQFDEAAVAAQKRLPSVNGRNGVTFAGAWTGFGFHEDGLVSGLAAAESLGGEIPWREPGPRFLEAAE